MINSTSYPYRHCPFVRNTKRILQTRQLTIAQFSQMVFEQGSYQAKRRRLQRILNGRTRACLATVQAVATQLDVCPGQLAFEAM